MRPTGLVCVIPSRLGAGEPFSLRIRVLGDFEPVACSGGFNNRKPDLRSPFNLNVDRQIRFMNNCLTGWTGTLTVEGEDGLHGPDRIDFNGTDQGIYPGDTRAIRRVQGFSFTRPGFHFIRLTDPVSGVTCSSNPVYVTKEKPRVRIFWGDPHWQTFFSDGVRCPEELYTFARDEASLDFGAVSDHMEAVTDRQWDYFKAVANDFNEPGRFVTLLGQEWTHHDPAHGAPGHRNIYFRGSDGPVLRSNDAHCNTLEKLWACLDRLPTGEAVAIPHHSANKIMGVKWELGWNPKYEKAVEMYSVWGSSEKSAAAGNTRPIHHCDGEVDGRHVIDALKRGYRMGFVGGSDNHDGRAGDARHMESYLPQEHPPYEQGYTAVMIPELTRSGVFDAIAGQQTYATTCSRIYLDAVYRDGHYFLKAASEDGIAEATMVHNGEDVTKIGPGTDERVIEQDDIAVPLAADDFCYIRVTTKKGNMAWSGPVWGA